LFLRITFRIRKHIAITANPARKLKEESIE